MPNGLHGSREAWKRATMPLEAVDRQLERFAEAHQMMVSGAERPFPTRSLTWGRPLRRKLEIVLADEGRLTYDVRGYAFVDRSGRRLWKQMLLASEVSAANLSTVLETVLTEGRLRVESWTEADLEDAGPVAGDAE